MDAFIVRFNPEIDCWPTMMIGSPTFDSMDYEAVEAFNEADKTIPIRVDKKKLRNVPVTLSPVRNKNLLVFNPKFEDLKNVTTLEIINEIKAGSMLRMVMGERVYKVDLTGSSNALGQALKVCQKQKPAHDADKAYFD